MKKIYSYFIKTFGCKMNYADSQTIEATLLSYGLKSVEKISEADLIVINSCSVRQSAEDRVFGLKKLFNLLKLKRKEKFFSINLPLVIITGCMSKREFISKIKQEKYLKKVKERTGSDFVIPIENFSTQISKILKNKLQTSNIKNSVQFNNDLSGLIPISTGCNEFCSYCIVPFSRGREINKTKDEIIKSVEKFLKNGKKDLLLLGQIVNKWKDPYTKSSFSSLLSTIDLKKENFWFSFISSSFKYMTNDLINYMQNSIGSASEKIIKNVEFSENSHLKSFINLPIQSGSPKILKKMNRDSNISNYLDIISTLRKKIPLISISTDVIIGFPGESRKEFQETLNFLKEANFDMIYINKYSKREGTAAYNFGETVSNQEKEMRELEVLKILKKSKIKKFGIIKNTKGRLLVESITQKGLNTVVFGKDFYFNDVLVKVSKKTSRKINKNSFIDFKYQKLNKLSYEGIEIPKFGD